MRLSVRRARGAIRSSRATAGPQGPCSDVRRAASAGFTETTQLDILLSEYAELTIEGNTAIHVTGARPAAAAASPGRLLMPSTARAGYYMPDFGEGGMDDDDDDEDEDEEDDEFGCAARRCAARAAGYRC